MIIVEDETLITFNLQQHIDEETKRHNGLLQGNIKLGVKRENNGILGVIIN
jgi:hypothetical protein